MATTLTIMNLSMGGFAKDHHTVDIALNCPSGSQVLLNTIMPAYVYTLVITIPLRYLPYWILYFKFNGATSKLNIAIKIQSLELPKIGAPG